MSRENNLDDRVLSYAEAIREALAQAMEKNKKVVVMGQGVNDAIGMFGATTGLEERFGEERIFDTPIAETGLTGVAVGMAMGGMRPVYCHNRPDFLMLSMDQIVNHAAKYNYMSGDQCKIPLVIWAVTGEGWGSAAQHSQTVHGIFMHIPGLKIVMPTTPYDAKGLFISAIEDNNPVLILDHRNLYSQKEYVPEEYYKVPIGKGILRREGNDITIVAISNMVSKAIKAAETLERQNIYADVIDIRSIKPLDEEIILESLKKTGRILIVDNGWKSCGAAAEIMAIVMEKGFEYLKTNARRITLPDIPTPAAYSLEEVYYKKEEDIYNEALKMLSMGK